MTVHQNPFGSRNLHLTAATVEAERLARWDNILASGYVPPLEGYFRLKRKFQDSRSSRASKLAVIESWAEETQPGSRGVAWFLKRAILVSIILAVALFCSGSDLI